MHCPVRQGFLSNTTGRPRCRLAALGLLALGAALATACTGLIAFGDRPAAAYLYGSGAPLRVAVIDSTGGGDWSPAIDATIARYGAAVPELAFQRSPDGANIVITVRRYDDSQPPQLAGYVFPAGAGGFAAVYDADGTACNYPPSPVPEHCTGEIADVDIYLNDIIPAGADIENRRQRLLLHELGHAFGLTRHTPDFAEAELAARFGW